MASLKLYTRSTTWWVSGTINGKRIRESTGHTDKKRAQQWAAKREWELTQQAVFGTESVLTFGAALQFYIEGGGEQRFLLPLLDEWEHRLVKDIAPGDVVDLAMKLHPAATAATRNRQVITPVMAIIRFNAQRGRCAPVLVKRFETKKVVKRRTATWEWMAKFTPAAKPKLVALVLFLANTAARIGDALKLQWQHVDLDAGSALLVDTKNGEDRLVSMSPDTVAALKAVRTKQPKATDVVFAFYDRSDVARQIKTACKKAGIEYIPTHGIGRRLFFTSMMRGGVDPRTAAEAGGLKSVRLYLETYAQPDNVGVALEKVFGTRLSQGGKPDAQNP
jgi:integrase